jgi:putative PIN family toxin of toxin-antitoxin system
MTECVVVADTNVFVSALLLPSSTAAQALNLALEQHIVVVSEHTLAELGGVLARKKFDRYITLDERLQYFELLAGVVRVVSVHHPIVACRDPKDDKFLSLALAAEATHILTGDQDLLVLHPFHDMAIVTPVIFLESIRDL